MFFSLAASPICFLSNSLGTLLYPSYSAAAIAVAVNINGVSRELIQ